MELCRGDMQQTMYIAAKMTNQKTRASYQTGQDLYIYIETRSIGPRAHRAQGLSGPRGRLGPGLFGPRTCLGTLGPGPVWAQGPLGPGPVCAQGPFGPRARLGPGSKRAQGPLGPGPVWAEGPFGHGQFDGVHFSKMFSKETFSGAQRVVFSGCCFS